MNGFIRKTLTGCCLGMVLFPLVGCVCYRDLVDPCWPERYNSMARHSVRDMNNIQMDKGHLLDQTIWNWMFEAEAKTGAATDRLSPAGLEQLRYISRRLPSPDFHVYLQNAQDIPYTPAGNPGQLVNVRNELNDRRIAAIQHFLATQTCALGGGGGWQVGIHDFAPPGINSIFITGSQIVPTPAAGAFQKLQSSFKGVLPTVSGFGSAPSAPQ